MFVTEETTIALPFGWAVAQPGSTIESGEASGPAGPSAP